MLALLMGTVLAIGALGFVLYPLFSGAGATPARFTPLEADATPSAEHEAVVALREIEFDRATGKLSDSDYDELRARYTQLALDAMRRGESGAPGDDAIEVAVLAFRARLKQCGRCGPRPEPDAGYCSTCGGYLPGACGTCGAEVGESSAAFCSSCGRQLASWSRLGASAG